MKKRLSMFMAVLLCTLMLAAPATASALPFQDVPETAWYYEDVKQCYETGVMTGVSQTEFAPGHEMTRAMFVKALMNHTLGRCPSQGKSQTFTDVNENAWYADAVKWASELEIIHGVGGGRFAPHRAITRSEASLILYRYSILCETDYEYSASVDDGIYDDYPPRSDPAYVSIEWVYRNNIMRGVTPRRFAPNASLTRAQTAAILTRISGMDNPNNDTYPYTVYWRGSALLTMQLPVSWKTECEILTYHSPDDGSLDRLATFHHKGSFWVDPDEPRASIGRLFSLDLIPAGASGGFYNYEKVQELVLDGKSYVLYMVFPSDIQFDVEDAEKTKGYLLMYNRRYQILRSIQCEPNRCAQ